MDVVLTDVERRRRLPWLVGAETLSMVFVLLTFSGSVFVLFLDELGLDTRQIGFLLALVPLCGIIAPFIAPTVARFGYKRTFVTFWGIRKAVIALLLFTPGVLARYGSNGAFIWVAAIIFVFAICRAIAETGGYPWKKDVVPDGIRGKYSAVNNMSTTVASILVAAVAGYVIEQQVGLAPFMLLIAVGVAVGLLSVVAFAQVPGEDPKQRQPAGARHLQDMKVAVRNRNFILFLAVLGLATIGGRAVISFVPLYMKEEIGLSDGIIVLLSVGTFIGALLTSFLWGWAADRYGSKPVMQLSLYLMLLLPIAWLLLPRNDPASAPLAMSIAVVAGVATLAWQISWTRYLFVNAISEENRSAYLAVFYAWFGLVAGLGPLLAGQLLTLSGDLQAQVGRISIGPYAPLFLMSIILVVMASFVVTRLQTEGRTTFRHFGGMFLRGNAVKALRLLVQYNLAGDEMTRQETTEQMGEAHSLLSSNELIEALRDPSFNVRYEAIRSIGRLPADEELVDALMAVLEDDESELSIVAARTLGKLGDQKAIPALRRTLFSGYPALEASSARTLAMLEDRESGEQFLEKLAVEPNRRLQLAYVSALGRLRVKEALPDLFDLLRGSRSESSRGEVGLAIARIVADERYYLQQWRSLQADFSTATAQAISAFQKPADRLDLVAIETVAEACAQDFATGNSERGINTLKTIMNWLPRDYLEEATVDVLRECGRDLKAFGDRRQEYVLLSLSTIDAAFKEIEAVRGTG